MRSEREREAKRKPIPSNLCIRYILALFTRTLPFSKLGERQLGDTRDTTFRTTWTTFDGNHYGRVERKFMDFVWPGLASSRPGLRLDLRSNRAAISETSTTNREHRPRARGERLLGVRLLCFISRSSTRRVPNTVPYCRNRRRLPIGALADFSS